MTDTFYKPWLDKWQVAIAGPKPTQANFDVAHGLGLRPGKQALAVAMSLRPGGVTRPQIIFVCGAPQMNKMGDLVKSGWLKRDMNHPPTNDGRNHYVYANSLTPKGQAEIDRNTKRQADKSTVIGKPAKVKASVKSPAKPVTKPKAQTVSTKRKSSKAPKPEVPQPEVPSAPVEPAAPEVPNTVQ